MAIVAFAVSLYTAEMLLMPKRNTIRKYAEAAGRSYDPRSPAQVVADLRGSGMRAYPAIHRGAARIRLAGGDAVALGGISGVTSVMCNETGTYALFDSDEHGFNNPRGLWSMAPIQIAVLGDSYTMGWCVAPEDGFVGNLRQSFPCTLNLGIGGNGPLTELATLREYLPRVRPAVVLWVYFENDLGDLEEEKMDPTLTRYLAPGSALGLADEQGTIDQQVANLIDQHRPMQMALSTPTLTERLTQHRVTQKLRQIASLHHLRGLVSAVSIGYAGGGARRDCCDLPLFARILGEAKQEVGTWGGANVPRLHPYAGPLFTRSYRFGKRCGAAGSARCTRGRGFAWTSGDRYT